MIAAYALYGRGQTEHKPSDAEIMSLIGAPDADPCAHVIASLAFDAASTNALRARSVVNDAVGAADQCADERLRAELLIHRIPYEREQPMIGPRGERAIEQAQAAASRVMQPDLAAAIASQRLIAAGSEPGGTRHSGWSRPSSQVTPRAACRCDSCKRCPPWRAPRCS